MGGCDVDERLVSAVYGTIVSDSIPLYIYITEFTELPTTNK